MWQWCWWHRYVGNFMMMTDLRCWWQNHYVGDFFRYVGDFLNVLNRSPTSQTCHKHIWSPTSVTNIDVTLTICQWLIGLKLGSIIIKVNWYDAMHQMHGVHNFCDVTYVPWHPFKLISFIKFESNRIWLMILNDQMEHVLFLYF